MCGLLKYVWSSYYILYTMCVWERQEYIYIYHEQNMCGLLTIFCIFVFNFLYTGHRDEEDFFYVLICEASKYIVCMCETSIYIYILCVRQANILCVCVRQAYIYRVYVWDKHIYCVYVWDKYIYCVRQVFYLLKIKKTQYIFVWDKHIYSFNKI